MIYFYEILFVLVAIAAIGIGERFSTLAALLFLAAWFVFITIGYASFGARLAAQQGLSEDDATWFRDARDGLRHLRLLFGIATVLTLVWRIVGG